MDNTNNGKKNLLQFIKFGLVGASNTLVDMLVQIALGFVILKFVEESWGVTYAVKGVDGPSKRSIPRAEKRSSASFS